MTTVHSPIDQHPDILALRAGYDRIAESMAAQATFGLTLMVAAYAALSPWSVGYFSLPRLTVNDVFVGGTVGVLALCFGCALDRTHGLTWTLPFFGVWMVAAPWIFQDAPTMGMIWSHVISGALIMMLGMCAAYLGMRVRGSEARHG